MTLREIKGYVQYLKTLRPLSIDIEYYNWLISKVERLREAIETHRDIIGETASVADVHLYEALER